MRPWLSMLAIAWLAVPVGDAQAAASSDYEITYFGEASLRTEVGRFYKPCGTGAARLTGRRTRFFVRATSRCSGAGRGPVAGGTLSCRFSQAGCTDDIVRRLLPIRASRRT